MRAKQTTLTWSKLFIECNGQFIFVFIHFWHIQKIEITAKKLKNGTIDFPITFIKNNLFSSVFLFLRNEISHAIWMIGLKEMQKKGEGGFSNWLSYFFYNQLFGI